MQNKVRDGLTLDYLNVTENRIKSGSLVPVKNIVGIATTNIDPNATAALTVTGVYRLEKLAEGIAQGDLVFVDAATGKITKAVSSEIDETNVAHVPAGVAWTNAAASDVYVCVGINK
jgi:predicted RecA/RadA family phage recombinase